MGEPNQSFCYVNSDGIAKGRYTTRPQNLASLSKLFTTLYALYNWGPNYQFKTTVYVKNKDAYIAGSLDPIFAARRVYQLIGELNRQGIKDLDHLYYNQKFIVRDSILSSNGHTQVYGLYPQFLINETAKQMKSMMNTQAWSAAQLENFNSLRGSFPQLPKAINFKLNYAKAIKNSTELPDIGLVNNYDFKFEILSAPLSDIVKFINVFSNNPGADLLFYKAGGSKNIISFFEDFIPELSTGFEFYSGSGLPIMQVSGQELRNLSLVNSTSESLDDAMTATFEQLEADATQKRMTNKSSCVAVLKLMEMWTEFEKSELINPIENFTDPSLLDNATALKKWLAVAGREGTIGGRYVAKKNQFLAKTGTLYDTSNLAGSLSSNDGQIHFALLFSLPTEQHNQPQTARDIQQNIMDIFFRRFEGGVPFEYKKSLSSSESTFFGTDKILTTSKNK
jgi:D-alanyl-D-alanine carboxypeptidase/D-alanyl-D-alanine-endopeptidase (penicillin-binding protein 4)